MENYLNKRLANVCTRNNIFTVENRKILVTIKKMAVKFVKYILEALLWIKKEFNFERSLQKNTTELV